MMKFDHTPLPSCPSEDEMGSISEDPPPTWEEAIGGDRPQDATRPTPRQAPPSRAALAWINRRYLLAFLIPVLLCPIPIVINNPMGYTAYTILVMAIFWCTELISIAITSLFPLVFFPVFGVMEAKDVSVQYFKNTVVLFFGGLMVAVAIEHCNMHRRIALGVLLLVGSKPRWMMFGLMAITAFLSMWISNTATTAMLLPIAKAVLDQVKVDSLKRENENEEDSSFKNGHGHGEKTNNIPMEEIENGVISVDNQPSDTRSQHDDESGKEARYNLMCKGILLCVPYAANIGGVATLTGTGPNLVFAGQVETLFGVEVSFGAWMAYALPGMIVCLFFAWVWLQILYVDRWCCKKLGEGELDHKGAARVIRREYNKLGPMSFAEKAVLVHFILLIVLWVTRKPGFVSGWSELFPKDYVTDATPAMLIGIMLFLVPSRMPDFLRRRIPEDESRNQNEKIPALLEWPVLNEKMCWQVILLLGGGFALAEGCQVSGLSAWIGDQFSTFDSFPPWVIALICSIIIACFTEVTSNSATATIFLPILAGLGASTGVHPYYYMLPSAMACSFSFMLPVATPPNAIAFAYEQITVMDMAKTGFMLNIICIIVFNISNNTLGKAVFDLGTFPEWANTTSVLAQVWRPMFGLWCAACGAPSGLVTCLNYFRLFQKKEKTDWSGHWSGWRAARCRPSTGGQAWASLRLTVF